MEPQKDKTPNFCEEIVIKTCRGLIVEDRDYFLLFGLLHHYRFILFSPIDDDGYTTSDFDGFSWRAQFKIRPWSNQLNWQESREFLKVCILDIAAKFE